MYVIYIVLVINLFNNICKLFIIVKWNNIFLKVLLKVCSIRISKNIINYKCMYIILFFYYKCIIRINILNIWDFIYICIWLIVNLVK